MQDTAQKQLNEAIKALTNEQLNEFVKTILKVLVNNKRQTDALNLQNKELIESAVNDYKKSGKKLTNDVEDKSDRLEKSNKDFQAKVKEEVAKVLDETKTAVKEFKKLKPKDGKNANPEDVVPLVLAKIEIPQAQEVELDGGEEIVDKINKLPETEEHQIDARHIKNLPSVSGGRTNGAVNIKVRDEGTVITKALRDINFVGSGVTATMLNGVVTVVISGGGGGGGSVSLETPSGTINGTNRTFTVLNTPKFLIVNGASIFENDTTSTTGYYTLSGLTITLSFDIFSPSTLRSVY